MNKAAFLLILGALVAGCHQEKAVKSPTVRNDSTVGADQPATQTIAPAEARPAPTGTEALTQTVEVEDSRSEDEGGVVTKPPATAKTTTAGTASKRKGESRGSKGPP